MFLLGFIKGYFNFACAWGSIHLPYEAQIVRPDKNIFPTKILVHLLVSRLMCYRMDILKLLTANTAYHDTGWHGVISAQH